MPRFVLLSYILDLAGALINELKLSTFQHFCWSIRSDALYLEAHLEPVLTAIREAINQLVVGAPMRHFVHYKHYEVADKVSLRDEAKLALQKAHDHMWEILRPFSAEQRSQSLTHVPVHRDIIAAYTQLTHPAQNGQHSVRLAHKDAPFGRMLHPSETVQL